MELFFNQVINGIQQGAIYAALALALVLIFRSTSLLNFAQGEMAMFSTFIAWILADNGFPVVFAILAAMAVSVVGGAIIERTLIRPVGSDNVAGHRHRHHRHLHRHERAGGVDLRHRRPGVPPHLPQRVAGHLR